MGAKTTTKGRILLVDDSSTNNLLFSNVLDDYGYETIKTYNAIKGLESVVNEKPDLVLLDLVMPGLSGIDFMQELYKKNIPANIIVITSVNNDKMREKAMALGADDYLLKPVELEEMVFKVNRIMAKRYSASA
jgi:DNA-binding response OmpR family regulator